MLEAACISVKVAGRYLLEEVSLALYPGELLAVVGPNGAGKSTLLRVLCGDLTPERGSVTLEGKPLAKWRSLEQAKKRAVLPQASSLSFPFTAFEVALMGRSPHVRGAETLHDHAITSAALRETQVLSLAGRDYPTLSGGEKQRVQLARVLAQVWEGEKSRYLLLDEPTNNLDLAHQHGTLQIAKGFAQRGVGVLAVLHDLNLAAQYADRVLLLHEGEVAAVGTSREVFTKETLHAVFETPVVVTSHPCLDCPLIISTAWVSAVGAEMTPPTKEYP